MQLIAPTAKPIKLQPVHPSVAERIAYQRQLEKLIDAMHTSVLYWVKASWRKSGLAEDEIFRALPSIVEDRSAAAMMQSAMNKLTQHWKKSFDSLSVDAAKIFTDKVKSHHDLAFKSALAKHGFGVKFQNTPEVQQAIDLTSMENVQLIKSIPEKYLADVHKHVVKSIVQGRNLKQLTNYLQETYDLARNRAALIARDQNNKATAAIHRARQKEVGIKTAQWVHTTASVHPREEHELWSDTGETYDIEKGMYSDEDGEYVWPGTPINCGCIAMSIIPGLEE